MIRHQKMQCLLTIKAISYSWVGVRAFHKFITKQVKQHHFWIGKILSLFRISPPLFSTIQIYGLCTNAQPRTLGYLLTLPPLAIIHKRLHPLLPRLVELGIIPAFATVISKADHPMLRCAKRRTPISSQ